MRLVKAERGRCRLAFASTFGALLAIALAWAQAAQAYDCSAHPWIDDALRDFFDPAYESTRTSTKTNEEALDAIANVKWGDYCTGKSMCILFPDHDKKRMSLRTELVCRHNEDHKPRGMEAVLRRAVEQHAEDLYRELGGREIKFIYGTEDWGIMGRGQGHKLPSFQMMTNQDGIDVPVPDFTFEVYGQTRYSNTSWWEIRRLMLLKAGMIPWEHRERDLFMRGDAGVGYRKVLMPFMHEVESNHTDLQLLGVKANVHSTGYYVSDKAHYVWLDNWCQHRYLIHTSGNSYSASLKYKLACGSVVIHFVNRATEFYYPALKDGIHTINIAEGDREYLLTKAAPEIKRRLQELEDKHRDTPPPVAQNARDFIATQLTDGGLGCYWYKAIAAYSKLYFANKPDEVPKEIYIAK